MPDALPGGWRRHSRAAHLAVIEEWAPRRDGLWLKTDLFEELHPDRALLPHLGAGAWLAIDVSPAVIGAAASNTRGPRPASAMACDVRRLGIRSGALNGVLSTSTLDHFDAAAALDEALRELRRVLVKGGLLILTLDNPTNPMIAVRNALPRRWQQRSGLVGYPVGATLSERAGRAALEGAGFSVDATLHLLHTPHILGTRLARFAWWERRALPAFDRLGHTRIAALSGHFVAFLARAV